MALSYLRYFWLKCLATALRTIVRFLHRGRPKPNPDDVLYVPSRDTGRLIKAHVYHPGAESKINPSPILLNFHGSGFVLPAHGSDGEYCRFIANNTNYTVLDVQYRLAPENPFPAAFHDVEDVVKHVLSQPNVYDAKRVALSGFSAGANLSVAVSSSSSLLPRETFSKVISFYSPADLYDDPAEKKAPDNTGKQIPAFISRFFHNCYVPPGVERRDPRISPSYAAPETMPNNFLVITGDQDPFAFEMEEVGNRAAGLPGRNVIIKRMEQCTHAWDKNAQEGTLQAKAKDEAYKSTAEFLLA
ncbi:esterase/lipase, putative [Paecilomyces variotii No. 5]|uniref:Esterase/lipase, putative n=1 Tax=Byssochlamys spectabilis (strain No. 5 / NBRC 109023) TaxID=1356009 RepID=V5G327_BYSSN|nr:esterase/lipase, putative [Paecilomyces variotii No. 5]